MPPLPTLDNTTNRLDQRPKQVCPAAVCVLPYDTGLASCHAAAAGLLHRVRRLEQDALLI